MRFADKLRCDAPTKAEIKEQELLKKRQREERIEAFFSKEFETELTLILRNCEEANRRGEKQLYSSGHHYLSCILPGPGDSLLNLKEKQAYCDRMERELRDSLKAEGFKRVRVSVDSVTSQLYYSLSWK